MLFDQGPPVDSDCERSSTPDNTEVELERFAVNMRDKLNALRKQLAAVREKQSELNSRSNQPSIPPAPMDVEESVVASEPALPAENDDPSSRLAALKARLALQTTSP